MSDKPKCRWIPRYGLRTLFVVVTVVAVLLAAGLGWYKRQVTWMQARAEAKAHLWPLYRWSFAVSPDRTRLPIGLRLVGERWAMEFFYVDENKIRPEDVKRLDEIKLLFPEATVRVR